MKRRFPERLSGLIISLMCLLVASTGYALNPLEDKNGWQLLSYSSIPPNQVEIENGEMIIAVNQSASPIIYPFQKPLAVSEISLDIRVIGQLQGMASAQGEKGADDFLFRLGLVYEGEQTQNIFQRAIAADWVKTLFALAPAGTGVDHIAFFNLFTDPQLEGKQRVHPASDLLHESFVLQAEDGETQLFRIQPDSDRKVLALWISSDGDDTGSAFTVRLNNFQVRTVSP
ncbi:hypothetical protein [Parendozoicomonas haliclonae]|uniref:Uncharacterized protein n=1 Tax=Parendozoicomonas haliclonae TaxID=1960125 RepID=A0A1X7AHM1_9GAMM|nr:hypothetical protein [Parendozoicomonas haliclonae]SMA41744.1 hypothetical protein EHSB41UT_01317 [Parendozoicomonas haliclonae]